MQNKRSQLGLHQTQAFSVAPTLYEARDALMAALDNLKAEDIVAIDLTHKAAFADLMLIASGTSSRHLASLADAVVAAARAHGQQPSIEGRPGSDWVCVDAGDIVVHLFTHASREHYRLEKLWSFPSFA